MKKHIYIIAIMVVSFLSCEKDVNVNIPYEAPRLVLNSIFHEGDTILAYASRSKHILESGSLSKIEDAAILLEENGKQVDKLIHLGNGRYRSNYVPVKNKSYRFVANASGVQSVSAVTTIPEKVEMDGLTLDSTTIENQFYRVVRVKFTDRGGVKLHYNLKLYERLTTYLPSGDSSVSTHQITYESHFDPIVEKVGGDESVGASFPNVVFSGKQVELSVRFNGFAFGQGSNPNQKREYIVVLSTITEDHYRYNRAYAKLSDDNGPFSEPVQMPTNVENGLGIVVGFSSSIKKIKIN